MGTTSKGLTYPDGSDDITNLETWFAVLSSSINDALPQGILYTQNTGIATSTSTSAAAAMTSGVITPLPGKRLIEVVISYMMFTATAAAVGQTTLTGPGATEYGAHRQSMNTVGITNGVRVSTSVYATVTAPFTSTLLMLRESGTGTVTLNYGLLQVIDHGAMA